MSFLVRKIPFRRVYSGVGTLTPFRFYSHESGHRPWECWSCQTPYDCEAYFCTACGTLQPIVQADGTYNYYSIFGMKQSFDLDVQEISRQFKNLQRLLHPDKYGQRTKQERRMSQECSTVVNEAYTVLSDPLRRALHLLQLRGVAVDERSLAASASTDPEFLMWVLDFNEELESVNSARALEGLESDLQSQIKKLMEELSQLFRESSLEKAKATVVKARYYTNMIEKVKEKKMELISIETSC